MINKSYDSKIFCDYCGDPVGYTYGAPIIWKFGDVRISCPKCITLNERRNVRSNLHCPVCDKILTAEEIDISVFDRDTRPFYKCSNCNNKMVIE